MNEKFCIDHATAVLRSALADNPVDQDDLLDIRLQCFVNGNVSIELAERLSIGLNELRLVMGDTLGGTIFH